jgi:hypothetical protein
MGSLFSGTPQVATSYTSSTTETPKWMQDAIYNQTQWATNVANTPYQEYSLPTVAGLSPLQQQAYSTVVQNQGNWKPGMAAATAGMVPFTTAGTAGDLEAQQNPYLQPTMASADLTAGRGLYNRAAGIDVTGAANPYMTAAGKSAVQNIGDYFNPYQQSVLDTIARQGTRNLTENLLPGVSDTFIKAGQFGSRGMGDFGERALRDTQEAILNAQSTAAQQGYSQALGASQADLARQQQLAATAGQLAGAQQQGLTSLGKEQTAAGQQQQTFGLNAAQAEQAAQAADLGRQMGALNQQASLAGQLQALGLSDIGALESAGLAQQAQEQARLSAAKGQFDIAQRYPQTQLDWLNAQIRGMAAQAPVTQTIASNESGKTYSASPLSQLASGVYAARGVDKMLS